MTYAAAAIISFVITAFLVPRMISFARRRRIYDDPRGNALKIHKNPVPPLGGIAIFAGFAVPLLGVSVLADGSFGFAGVLACSALVAGLGLWDDLKDINPRLRLVLQIVLAGLAVFLGFTIDTFPYAYIAVPLTMAVITGAMNSVNLFDGLDGLAGGVVSISLCGFGALFYLKGDYASLLMCAAMLGAVLGFLIYNFNPASIFMGDNGSTLLGFILGILAVRASSTPYDIASFALSIALIGLPVLDTAAAITRRYLAGRPVFIGDRSHIYDQLVDHGYTVRQTALICYTIQLCLVGITILILAA